MAAIHMHEFQAVFFYRLSLNLRRFKQLSERHGPALPVFWFKHNRLVSRMVEHYDLHRRCGPFSPKASPE